MTVSHDSRIRVTDSWQHENTADIATTRDKEDLSIDQAFADGNGDDQAQDMFRDRRTVSPGEGNEDQLDLAGTLLDVFGNTLSFVTIKQIWIHNRATAAGENILIGGPSDPTTGALMTDLFDGDIDSRLKIKAGYLFLLVGGLAGYTVTGGSADIVLITNAGTAAIEYDVVFKGTRD